MQRNPRSYKITDVDYNRALNRGKRQMPLAQVLEQTAQFYGKGYAIMVRDQWGNYGTIADLEGLHKKSKTNKNSK